MNNHRQQIVDYVNQWHTEGAVESVNMGGLGDGYDTGIQCIIMEILEKVALNQPDSSFVPMENAEDRKKLRRLFEKAISEDYSGAMVEQGVCVAYQFMVYGIDYMMEKARIQCPERIRTFKNPQYREKVTTNE